MSGCLVHTSGMSSASFRHLKPYVGLLGFAPTKLWADWIAWSARRRMDWGEKLVGRGRIELPTPGFSDLSFKSRKCLEILDLQS